MERYLGKYSSQIYALLRIVSGFLFACHGAQKLFGVLGGTAVESLASRPGAAGIIEFFGGLLIMGGLFTSSTAFIASGEMAFAYFLSHAPRGLWPIMNRGERAVLFCFLFLYIASRGPGIWSLDGLLGRGSSTDRR